MDSFVPAVLLRAAGPDPLVRDPQVREPDGEARQATEADGCEGRPVVGTHRLGKAELAERGFEDRSHR